jgi:hypothetical protein
VELGSSVEGRGMIGQREEGRSFSHFILVYNSLNMYEPFFTETPT